jgi:hypothetical protein
MGTIQSTRSRSWKDTLTLKPKFGAGSVLFDRGNSKGRLLILCWVLLILVNRITSWEDRRVKLRAVKQILSKTMDCAVVYIAFDQLSDLFADNQCRSRV